MKIDQKHIDMSKLSEAIKEMKEKFRELLDLFDNEVGLKVETKIDSKGKLIVAVNLDCKDADKMFNPEIRPFPYKQGWDFL
jgi:hypothetical protein